MLPFFNKSVASPRPGLLWPLVVLCCFGCGRVDPGSASWLVNTTHQPHQARHEQWSSHRGGVLHGVATSSRLPVHFDRAHTNLRWSLKLPGRGNSSPTVFGNRIFLTAHNTTGTRDLILCCIDRVTGSMQWSRRCSSRFHCNLQ